VADVRHVRGPWGSMYVFYAVVFYSMCFRFRQVQPIRLAISRSMCQNSFFLFLTFFIDFNLLLFNCEKLAFSACSKNVAKIFRTLCLYGNKFLHTLRIQQQIVGIGHICSLRENHDIFVLVSEHCLQNF
jgi:hypothetical protein